MMAKDPKDRYQRPEHLVQHLLQVAQKLGGVEVPEGVFFVDAPLPSRRANGRLVLAGIARGRTRHLCAGRRRDATARSTVPLYRSKAWW